MPGHVVEESVALVRRQRAVDAQVFLLGVIATGVLAYSWWGTDWHSRIGVPVPYRRIPVPVLWWAVLGAYYAAILKRTGLRIAALGTAVVDGIALHFQWALVSLLVDGQFRESVGPLYSRYIVAVVFTLTGLVAYRAGTAASTLGTGGAAALRVPIVAGAALAVFRLLAFGDWPLALFVTVMALVGWRVATARHDLLLHMWSWPADARLREWAPVAMIALVAVSIRLAWYFHLVRLIGFDYRTGFVAASDDGQTYHRIATELASDPSRFFGKSNPVATAYFDPLYSVLLGLWYWAAGISFTPAVVVQCLLAVIPIAVAYVLAKRLSGGSQVAGLIAAAFVAFSQPLISFSAIYGIEAVYIPVLCLWVCAAWRYSEGASWKAVVWLGVLGGMIVGLRRFGPLFMVALLPWMLWAGRGRPVSARVWAWAAAMALTVAVYAPLELMYARTGQSRLAKPPATDYVWMQRSPFPDVVPDNARLIAAGLDPARPGASLRAIVTHPIEVVSAMWAVIPTRLAAFFFWPAFGQFDTIVLVNPRFRNPFTPVAEFYLALAALGGIVWSLFRRNTRVLAGLLLLVIAVQAFASAVIFITNSVRYSAPIRPFLMVFAAAGVVLTLRQLGCARTGQVDGTT